MAIRYPETDEERILYRQRALKPKDMAYLLDLSVITVQGMLARGVFQKAWQVEEDGSWRMWPEDFDEWTKERQRIAQENKRERKPSRGKR